MVLLALVGRGEIHGTFCNGYISLVAGIRGGTGGGGVLEGRGGDLRLYQSLDSDGGQRGGGEKNYYKTIGEIKNLWRPCYGGRGLLISTTLSFHSRVLHVW